LAESPYVSSDSTLRHAGAQQCWHRRSRIVLATLRDAKRACTTQELTMHVMAERGVNTADKRLVKTVGKRVGACLRHHRTKGLIQSAEGLGDRIAWEVARRRHLERA
jgi:hypothetical protein